MSYSISFTAPTKSAALEQFKQEFAAIVSQQPEHVHDQELVTETVEKNLALIEDPAENEHVVLNVVGSVAWQNATSPKGEPVRKYVNVALSVGAYLTVVS